MKDITPILQGPTTPNLITVHPSVAAKSLSDTAPAEWTVVTRDLYQDFGQQTIKGIATHMMGLKIKLRSNREELTERGARTWRSASDPTS